MRQTSITGISLIKRLEGERLNAYLDVVGIPTIGVGHTGPEVHMGQTITAQQSSDLLRRDLGTAEKAINSLVSVPISQNQFDALVSLVFNIGVGAFKKSTLLRKLHARDYDGARAQFAVWNHAGGKPNAALTTRRRAEALLFGTP